MGRVVYSAAMSLDGFIAGAGGDMQWMTEHLGPNPAVEEMVPHVGALLVGRRTFGGDDPHRGTEQEGEPFGGGFDGRQFVLTHRPPAEPVPGVTFVGDLDDGVAAAKAAAGERDVHVLGASVARQCLAAGVLDELVVAVVPVLLGDGVRLFDHPGGTHVRLEPIAIASPPHVTNVRYRVVR